jgi:hypothetical protein
MKKVQARPFKGRKHRISNYFERKAPTIIHIGLFLLDVALFNSNDLKE